MWDNSEHIVEVSTDSPGDLQVTGWRNSVDWTFSHKVEELEGSSRTRMNTSKTNQYHMMIVIETFYGEATKISHYLPSASCVPGALWKLFYLILSVTPQAMDHQ